MIPDVYQCITRRSCERLDDDDPDAHPDLLNLSVTSLDDFCDVADLYGSRTEAPDRCVMVVLHGRRIGLHKSTPSYVPDGAQVIGVPSGRVLMERKVAG